MVNSPSFIGFIVLVVLIVTFALISAFAFADRLMFFLQMTFVGSAATAVWGAMTRHALTEYAVWTMYVVSIALAGLMVLRSRKQGPPPDFEASKLP